MLTPFHFFESEVWQYSQPDFCHLSKDCEDVMYHGFGGINSDEKVVDINLTIDIDRLYILCNLVQLNDLVLKYS